MAASRTCALAASNCSVKTGASPVGHDDPLAGDALLDQPVQRAQRGLLVAESLPAVAAIHRVTAASSARWSGSRRPAARDQQHGDHDAAGMMTAEMS